MRGMGGIVLFIIFNGTKIAKKSVLSVEEIDAMIACIDPGALEAVRDRALMETLYGCGLRVSELLNLELSKVFLDEGFISVCNVSTSAVATLMPHSSRYSASLRASAR